MNVLTNSLTYLPYDLRMGRRKTLTFKNTYGRMNNIKLRNEMREYRNMSFTQGKRKTIPPTEAGICRKRITIALWKWANRALIPSIANTFLSEVPIAYEGNFYSLPEIAEAEDRQKPALCLFASRIGSFHFFQI